MKKTSADSCSSCQSLRSGCRNWRISHLRFWVYFVDVLHLIKEKTWHTSVSQSDLMWLNFSRFPQVKHLRPSCLAADKWGDCLWLWVSWFTSSSTSSESCSQEEFNSSNPARCGKTATPPPPTTTTTLKGNITNQTPGFLFVSLFLSLQ